jgi:hypothetical protein
MNQRSPGGLPGLGRKPSKPHLNTSVSLKKPKNFINFDDSEIFCDIKQQSMKDAGTTPAKLKTSRTIDGMMTSQRWHRKSSEHQLKSIVIGSQTSIKRLEDQKNVNRASWPVRNFDTDARN